MSRPGRAAFEEAARLHAQGRLPEAARRCDEAVAREPGFAPALHLRGLIALQSGDLATAASWLGQALQLSPRDASIHHSLGLLGRAARRGPEAVASFRESVRLDPRPFHAWNSLGLALLDTGDAPGAAQAFGEALRRDARNAEALHNLGLSLERSGRAEEAEAHYRRALAARPGQRPTLLALGRLLVDRSSFAEAEALLAQALALDASWSDARGALSLAIAGQGRLDEAEALLRAAPEASHPSIAVNLANLLARRRRPTEALRLLDEAAARLPDHPLVAHNRANVLADLGHVDEAIAGYRRALALAPGYADPRFALSRWLLARGDLAAGWEAFASRPLVLPPWMPKAGLSRASDAAAVDRARTARAIEVVEEQGFGDVVFFMRWAPWLAAQGWSVRLRCGPRLAPVLARTGPWSLQEAPGAPLGEDRASFPIGDLPLLVARLGGPASMPSLRVAPLEDRLQAARQALAEAGPAPYTALTWRAGLGQRYAGRDLLSKEVDPVAFWRHVDPGGTLVALQRDVQPGEVEALRPHAAAVADLGGWTEDLESLLGLLAAIDGYAGVSSTSVHLLALLGRHATIAVPWPPEWRWAEAGESPWFPGCRVIRQRAGEAWDAAMARELPRAG